MLYNYKVTAKPMIAESNPAFTQHQIMYKAVFKNFQ